VKGGFSMTKIRVNKMDVARRQLDAAIRMTFQGEDPVAIHSIADAAHKIIRNICESRHDITSYSRIKDIVRPGHMREFWAAVNRSGNFFKHADKDTNAIHEMDEEETDFAIFFAALWYHDLGFSLTPEMKVFMWWVAMCHPEMLMPDASAIWSAEMTVDLDAMVDTLKSLTRQHRLKAGKMLLQNEVATIVEKGEPKGT
jgi:hypothetical protein